MLPIRHLLSDQEENAIRKALHNNVVIHCLKVTGGDKVIGTTTSGMKIIGNYGKA